MRNREKNKNFNVIKNFDYKLKFVFRKAIIIFLKMVNYYNLILFYIIKNIMSSECLFYNNNNNIEIA